MIIICHLIFVIRRFLSTINTIECGYVAAHCICAAVMIFDVKIADVAVEGANFRIAVLIFCRCSSLFVGLISSHCS